jgi:hypothetical protein
MIEGGNKLISSVQSARGLVNSGAIDRDGVLGGLGAGGLVSSSFNRTKEGQKYFEGLEAKARMAANETQGIGLRYMNMNEKARVEAMSSVQAASAMGFEAKLAEGKEIRNKFGGIAGNLSGMYHRMGLTEYLKQSADMKLQSAIGDAKGFKDSKIASGNKDIAFDNAAYSTESKMLSTAQRIATLGGHDKAVSMDVSSAAVQAAEQRGAVSAKIAQAVSQENGGPLDPAKAQEFGRAMSESFLQTLKSNPDALKGSLSNLEKLSNTLTQGDLASKFGNIQGADESGAGYIKTQGVQGHAQGYKSGIQTLYHGNNEQVSAGLSKLHQRLDPKGKEELQQWLDKAYGDEWGIDGKGNILLHNATAKQNAALFAGMGALSGIGRQVTLGKQLANLQTNPLTGEMFANIQGIEHNESQTSQFGGGARQWIEQKLDEMFGAGAGKTGLQALDFGADAGKTLVAGYAALKLGGWAKNKLGGKPPVAPTAAAMTAAQLKSVKTPPHYVSYVNAQGVRKTVNPQDFMDVSDYMNDVNSNSASRITDKKFNQQLNETLNRYAAGEVAIGQDGHGKNRMYDLTDVKQVQEFLKNDKTNFSNLKSSAREIALDTLNNDLSARSGVDPKISKAKMLKLGGGLVGFAALADTLVRAGSVKQAYTDIKDSIKGTVAYNYEKNDGHVPRTWVDSLAAVGAGQGATDFARQLSYEAGRHYQDGNYGKMALSGVQAAGVTVLGGAEQAANGILSVLNMPVAFGTSIITGKSYSETREKQLESLNISYISDTSALAAKTMETNEQLKIQELAFAQTQQYNNMVAQIAEFQAEFQEGFKTLNDEKQTK